MMNTEIINFLDITLHLHAKLYYCKPNQMIQYINVSSNHSKSSINSLVTATQ